MLESEPPALSSPYSIVVPCDYNFSDTERFHWKSLPQTCWTVLGGTYLRPDSTTPLHNLRDSPPLGIIALLADDVLNHHGGREIGRDGEDFEIPGTAQEKSQSSNPGNGKGIPKKLNLKDKKGRTTHIVLPLYLSSQTLEDLLKMCIFVCSAENM